MQVMLEFASKYEVAFEYFPEESEINSLPRQWVINILNAVIGDNFRSFISERIEERNRRMIIEKQQEIEIKPSLLAAFKNSTYLSSKYSRLIY